MPNWKPSLRAPRWSWRSMPWLGGLFIAAIVALATVDIVRSHDSAVAETGRELDAQARLIAEQTARSLQAVDLVLRHIGDEYRSRALARLDAPGLHAYLKDQAVGLVQIEGLSIADPAGRLRSSTVAFPMPEPAPEVGAVEAFRTLKAARHAGSLVDSPVRSVLKPGQWVFPIARRLETPEGDFAGVVAAAGRVDYFQQFYRDARLDEGTTITLMHHNGALLARHPPVEAALGQRYPLLDSMLAQPAAGRSGPLRAVSPVDGVDRFGAVERVPDQPLVVVVTRDVSVAMAPWRAQTRGTVLRTLALGTLAALLLALLRRQFLRLDRARASLEVSRERFALAAAGADDGIWDWNIATDQVFASARAREVFGIGPGPEQFAGGAWFGTLRIHPDDSEARRAAIDAHLAGATAAYEGEYRVRHADGQYRWVRARGVCVRDAAGTPVRMAGSVADIDARKRAEDALRLSEERYALAMTGSTGGHWVWDITSDALFVSDTLNQLFGLPPDTRPATRKAYFQHVSVHPDDLGTLVHINDEVLAGRSSRIDFEYRILLPGGEGARWILTRAQCFRDGQGKALRMAGVSVDISERKRTEEALRLSEERFALAVAGSNDGILDWDLVNDRMYTSERTMEMLGVDSTVTLRTRAEWLALLRLHPDDRERHAAQLREFLASGAVLREGEYRVDRGNGVYRWVRLRNLCVRDVDGRPLRLAGSVSDIDAYKRVEVALRESEERYALAMTGSNEGHWVWDLTSDQAYASPRMNQILGLPARAHQSGYAEYLARIPMHPDDRPVVRKAREEHLAGTKSRMDVEYRIVVAGSGEIRWIHARGQCFRDAAGRPVQLAGSIEDITERKRTEEALRRSEERYALAVAGSDDGVWDWDFAAGLAFESARARELQGLPPGPELQPLGALEESLRVHPDDAARRAEGIRAHLAGETAAYECEYRVRQADDSYRWIRVRALCIRDAAGQPFRMAGSVSDIDARKRAEEAQRSSDERYQLAVAGSNEGLWDWDLESDSLFLSPRLQELLLPQAGETQRPRREWIALARFHPDDAHVVREAVSAHLRGRTRHYKIEYRLRHHSGEWHWYRQRGIAVCDAQGRPTRMAGSMEDITDRKNGEAERERLEGQLRQAQKLEAIGTLAGGIAHDFNNILAAILGYGEMALKDAPDGSAQRRYIDAALSAGMRAKSLVERILAFSRSGMGERVPVHVHSVVLEALDLVKASLPANVRLESELDSGNAAVLGDPTQIHQVVMNLCANAAQAMRSGGTLTATLDRIDLHEPRCVTSVLPDGNYVRLRVRDTGSGIAPQLLERIFDPFFTTKEIGVGTGLGLSLVHGIVTDLGGGIDVESQPGVGSTFTIYLPWQSCVAAPETVAETVPSGNGQTVLLVDDEEALVRLGEEMIAGLGYEPIGFTSSVAALEAFRVQPARFDVVLSDESMPDMTGSELAKAVRALRGDVPIVLMSGYVTPALSQRAREAGVAEVLAKPLVARDIARSLAGALARPAPTPEPAPRFN